MSQDLFLRVYCLCALQCLVHQITDIMWHSPVFVSWIIGREQQKPKHYDGVSISDDHYSHQHRELGLCTGFSYTTSKYHVMAGTPRSGGPWISKSSTSRSPTRGKLCFISLRSVEDTSTAVASPTRKCPCIQYRHIYVRS